MLQKDNKNPLKKERKKPDAELHPREEAFLRLKRYLMRNTDREHPVTGYADIKRRGEIAACAGTKEAFKQRVLAMANVLNTDEDESPLSEDQWQIMYDDYRDRYGDNADFEGDDDWEDERKKKHRGLPVHNLYYQHCFTYEEIDCLLESLAFNQTLDTETVSTIRGKILRHLTTRFYKDKLRSVSRVHTPEPPDRERLHDNIAVIRAAMEKDVKIRFRFNGYNRKGKLESTGRGPHTVSPYYIVANGGRFYLIASTDRSSTPAHDMSIWRIDLMTEIEIPGAVPSRGIAGQKRVPKREVANLPERWTDDFQTAHMNMAFDAPEKIVLRVTPNPDLPGFTFLHDWFGGAYQPVGTDLVQVTCSPWAMARWALQYGEYVEVVSPQSVRDEVGRLVRALYAKYGLGQ